MTTLDSQQVEILGRNILVTHLVAGGLEVARPERDKGIDLIAYLDDDGTFDAFPIQMKAGRKQSFQIDRKYEGVTGLRLAYVWNVDAPDDAEVYVLTFPEALAIAEEMGWTKTASWAKGYYATTSPSKGLRELLAPYRTEPDDWRTALTRRRPKPKRR